MKVSTRKSIFVHLHLIIACCFFLFSSCTSEISKKDPVDYVDPYIGTIAMLLQTTSPTVQLPHGMARIAPRFTPGIYDKYLADKIYSFQVGRSWIMSTTGELMVSQPAIASGFDHDFEEVSPHNGKVLLEDYDITAEYTVTNHALFYRFTYPGDSKAHILIGNNTAVEIFGDRIIQGVEKGGLNVWFHAVFSEPFSVSGTWKEGIPDHGGISQSGQEVGAYASFSPKKGDQVLVKIGISFIDADQAKANLEMEIPGWNYDAVKDEARRTWNEALNRIKVEGGTEKQRTIFYTSLYRALGRMTNITEYGRYYSGFDGMIHETDGHDFYTNDGLWDTYRCMHPLQMIIEPERRIDILQSYVRMYEQSGWMPAFPGLAGGGNANVMIGHHATAMINDSYAKGFRDFDAEKAYEGMRKNALQKTMLSRYNGNGRATELDSVYYEKGYFPALAFGEEEWVPQVNQGMRRQSVSVTLEHCFDDWALAQMAERLGIEEDHTHFMNRAHNYRNLFHIETGFMRPRTSDGTWIEPFDPIWSGGHGGRDYYTEMNGWDYTWFVPHDPEGLIRLMGGRKEFLDKLQTYFTTTVDLYASRSKFHFLSQFPDKTGWIGMYSQGNEPAHHIPYLYNYAGQPWKTQRRIRQIMDIWFGDVPMGVPGDEDGGSMSAWYVFSAMGFFPFCPGRPSYDIGSPVFEKITIDVGGGNKFVVEAPGASAQNKYIQSATLNGKTLNKPWFEHSELVNGGKLFLEMGPRPNKEWGSAPGEAPPSMTE